MRFRLLICLTASVAVCMAQTSGETETPDLNNLSSAPLIWMEIEADPFAFASQTIVANGDGELWFLSVLHHGEGTCCSEDWSLVVHPQWSANQS